MDTIDELVKTLKILSLYDLATAAEQNAWDKTLERLVEAAKTEGTLDAFDMIDSEVAERD